MTNSQQRHCHWNVAKHQVYNFSIYNSVTANYSCAQPNTICGCSVTLLIHTQASSKAAEAGLRIWRGKPNIGKPVRRDTSKRTMSQDNCCHFT